MIYHGIGLGLRAQMANDFLSEPRPEVAFVEVHPENYVGRGGKFRENLHRAQDRYSVLTHGLTMCFGSPWAFETEFLSATKRFLKEVAAPWHSDHLCMAGAHGRFVHDLLPIPFTDESLELMSTRIRQMQDALSIPIAVENVSYYAPMADDPLIEAEFVAELLSRTGALLMLDVNNVVVNSRNFGFDAKEWLARVPLERVVQMHVAGHERRPDGLCIDTHGEDVPEPVYELLEWVLEQTGPKPVLLERDNKIPPVDALLAEVSALRTVYDRAMDKRSRRSTPASSLAAAAEAYTS